MSVSSVQDGRVTYTSSASEAEIRESIGLPVEAEAPASTTTDVIPDEQPKDLAPEPEAVPERDASGKFVGKPKDAPVEAKPDKYGGDPRKSPQAKINYERQRAEAAERRALDAESRLAARPEPQAQPEPVAKPSTWPELVKRYQADPDYPKLEDFVGDASFADPYAAFNAAQAAFLQDKRLAERDQQASRQTAETRAFERFNASNEAGAEKYADWQDVITLPLASAPLPMPVIEEIFDHDSSADLRYYLLSHPDEHQRLQGVTDWIAAARAIARIATLLDVAAPSGPAVEPPRSTRAKPLIRPVSASPAAPESANPADLPFGPKYIEAMNAQERRQKASRGA